MVIAHQYVIASENDNFRLTGILLEILSSFAVIHHWCHHSAPGCKKIIVAGKYGTAWDLSLMNEKIEPRKSETIVHMNSLVECYIGLRRDGVRSQFAAVARSLSTLISVFAQEAAAVAE